MQFARLCLLLGGVLAYATTMASAASSPQLPPWFPLKGIFWVNPDQVTAENFGTDTLQDRARRRRL